MRHYRCKRCADKAPDKAPEAEPRLFKCSPEVAGTLGANSVKTQLNAEQRIMWLLIIREEPQIALPLSPFPKHYVHCYNQSGPLHRSFAELLPRNLRYFPDNFSEHPASHATEITSHAHVTQPGFPAQRRKLEEESTAGRQGTEAITTSSKRKLLRIRARLKSGGTRILQWAKDLPRQWK